MSSRLDGFDYTQPFFYMVTLKKRTGVADFAVLAPPGAPPPRDGKGRERWLLANAVTPAFAKTIRGFSETWRGIAPIECFIVMPDHLHLLLKIEDTPDRFPLGSYVVHLVRALGTAFWAALGGGDGPVTVPQNSDGAPPSESSRTAGATPSESGRAVTGPPHPPVFETDWHDWIVMKKGQLAAFTRYIRDNPRRAWLRRENRRFFTRLGKLAFAGREWFAYGNPALLELPVLEPFRCSRSWAEDGPEWQEAVARASRIGPGGAGVGTFLSPCEKACGNAIFKAGGSFVVLAPEGFPDRWHSGRAKEALCAEGRMLFLSLWPPQTSRPDNPTLHRRCHEMGELILARENMSIRSG